MLGKVICSRTALAVLVLGTTLLGACTRSGSTSSGFQGTAQEIADKIGCTNFTIDNDSLTPFVDVSGECDFQGESISIDTFSDSRDRENFEGFRNTAGCAFAKEMGVTNYSFVRGDRWVIDSGKYGVDKAIQAIIGGDFVSIDC